MLTQWINELNPTNVKVVTGCAMALILLVGVLTAVLLGIAVSDMLLFELCTFVCAVLGIAYRSYSRERETDYGYLERTADGAAKIEAAKAKAEGQP